METKEFKINARARMVFDDWLWFDEFTKATANIDVSQPEFFRRSHLGYQKYLYLMAHSPVAMENMSFAPCPPIDLMWHTHILQPDAYFRDSLHLLFSVKHHKLLARCKRTPVFYESRLNKEDKLWSSVFGESLSVYLLPLDPK